ncbi:MAG TPA: phage holin family protein [Trebonia sp.]|jgi:hypothetical protein
MVTEDLRRAGGTVDGRRRAVPATDRHVSDLTTQLGEQVTRLIRAETALARASLFASARQAVMGGGLLGAAAVVGLGAWLALVAAAVAGIAEGLPVWASALIVGGALGLLAGALALLGRQRLTRTAPPLKMTADSVVTDLGELAASGRHPGAHAPNGSGQNGRQR